MKVVKGTETIVNPLQKSSLHKKGLCDYVINIASGCLHGCTFCYVPSTPAIRARQSELMSRGVENPQLDWGKYLFLRQEIPEKLDIILSRKRIWNYTPSGKGVVLLCSGTDPYQNAETALITRQTIEVLIKHQKRVRILTRSPRWVKDLDLLKNPNITVGMSLPHLNDHLSRQIEPYAPLPSLRFEALKAGYEAGCRLYVALAPTPPEMDYEEFHHLLSKVLELKPEVIFWEPINARGTNGRRMQAAGLDFAESVMSRDAWANSFVHQWEAIERAALELDCTERLHIWVDAELEHYVPASKLQAWFYRPTCERWLADPYSPLDSYPLIDVESISNR
ncbi:MAG: radical SAM protein [Acaryochloridaceae cyanobacterium RU_4_10]|nr:radical SAM protein [Acaryochloridaceae cyanobacterium RU_4_10]